MLTYEDCLGLCDLTEEEIEAIAVHENIPEIVALELGNYLVHDKDGVPRIKKIIIDNIEAAKACDDQQQVVLLKKVLKHFVVSHPEHVAMS